MYRSHVRLRRHATVVLCLESEHHVCMIPHQFESQQVKQSTAVLRYQSLSDSCPFLHLQAPDLVSWNPLKAIAQSVLNPLGLFNHSAVAPSPQPADGLAWNKSIADPLVASDNTTSSSAANPIWILPLNALQLLNKTEQLNPLDAFKATEPLNATDLAAPVQLATSPSSDEGSPKWKLPVPINGTHHGLAAMLDAGGP